MDGFAPKVSFRSAQIETMRAFVAAGWGVSVVPKMACGPEDAGKVVYRPLGGMSRSIGLVSHEQRPPSRAAAALMDFFKADAQT